MNRFHKYYYLATAYIPRKLPTHPTQYDYMKTVFVEAYGVRDWPGAWETFAAQVYSTPATSIRKAWGNIANACKRVDMNGLARQYKDYAAFALDQYLKETAAKVAEAEKAQNDNPTQEGVTQTDGQPESQTGTTETTSQKTDLSEPTLEFGVGHSRTLQ